MGSALNRFNAKDKHSWPRRMLSFLGRKVDLPDDEHAWSYRTIKKYGNIGRKVAEYHRKYKSIDESRELKYYDGVMSEQAKVVRDKGYDKIDEMALELLEKGYRIVKSSAITPKGGDYDNKAPDANNLFYEQRFNQEEFIGLYDYFGCYQNNFPDYFSEKGAFEEYVKTHDIWVVEEIETGRPVAFSTYCINSNEEDRKLYGTREDQKLLYHDTVALDAELQGKGIGMKIMDIMDAYYLRTMGRDNINFALCTGDINSNDKGIISKGFHEKRGFGNWVEGTAPFKKWVDRFVNGVNKKYNGKAPEKPKLMVASYRNGLSI